MRLMLEHFSKSFDYIVIDSPPIGPVIDARVLASLADKIIYCVKWRTTTREIVEKHISLFKENKKLAGVVLNVVNEAKTPRYGPYSHYTPQYYHRYYVN